MSETPFEKFLLSQLISYLKEEISAGQRYQFRSPDPGNTNELILNLRQAADSKIDLDGVLAPIHQHQRDSFDMCGSQRRPENN